MHFRLVVFITGLAHITLPTSSDEAFVVGGTDGLIFITDTTGTGHNTTYPANTFTRALQIPFADGTAPAHTVVNSGPCQASSEVVTSP